MRKRNPEEALEEVTRKAHDVVDQTSSAVSSIVNAGKIVVYSLAAMAAGVVVIAAVFVLALMSYKWQ